MGVLEQEAGKEKKDPISSFRLAGRSGLEGSYTVEASFMMAFVLFAMITLLQAAYKQCRITTGMMRTHQMVEILRHNEEEAKEVLTVDGGAYRIEVVKKKDQVTGSVQGDGWERSIVQDVFKPEEFMRMLTLIQE